MVKHYGITYDQYLSMLEAQGGVCAICKQRPIKQRLVVDHDHRTKTVRGLLCHRCNIGIGNLRDSLDVLERAKVYLQYTDNPVPPETQLSVRQEEIDLKRLRIEVGVLRDENGRLEERLRALAWLQQAQAAGQQNPSTEQPVDPLPEAAAPA